MYLNTSKSVIRLNYRMTAFRNYELSSVTPNPDSLPTSGVPLGAQKDVQPILFKTDSEFSF